MARARRGWLGTSSARAAATHDARERASQRLKRLKRLAAVPAAATMQQSERPPCVADGPRRCRHDRRAGVPREWRKLRGAEAGLRRAQRSQDARSIQAANVGRTDAAGRLTRALDTV